MSKKFDAIVADATARSAALIEAIPHNRTAHRTNAERLVAICKDLVCARPVQEPLTPLVTEAGQIRFGKFPAEQSLLNRYGALLRIWRDAFRKIIDVSAPKLPKQGNSMTVSDEDIASLDQGTKARVVLIMAVLREQKVENDRLKKLLREQVPAPGYSGVAPVASCLPPGVQPVIGRWLALLKEGNAGLETDVLGVHISRRSRPGQVIMPVDVLEALRAICSGSEPSAISGPVAPS